MMDSDVIEKYIRESVKNNTIQLAKIAYEEGVAPDAVKHMFVIGLKCTEAESEELFEQYILERGE